MSIPTLPSHYLTIAEVAQVPRVSKMTVYRLVHAHALAAMRFGNFYRIPEDAVEECVRKAATPADTTVSTPNGWWSWTVHRRNSATTPVVTMNAGRGNWNSS